MVSYVLSVQERLAKMSALARENLGNVQWTQKQWYDKRAQVREFIVGENVFVLLPTSTSKLLAKWQGPYPVLRKLSPVNYELDMFDHTKRRRVFHINMLRKWHPPVVSNLWVEGKDPDIVQDKVILWKEGEG